MYAAFRRSAKRNNASINKRIYPPGSRIMGGGGKTGCDKLTSFIVLDGEILSKYNSLISDKDIKITKADIRETINGISFNIKCEFIGYEDKETKAIVSAINFYIHWFSSKDLHFTYNKEVANIEIYMYNINHNKTVDASATDIGRYVLSQKEVNTGFTVFLGRSEERNAGSGRSNSNANTNAIYIYRNEEHIKVLLHELVHATLCEYVYMPDMTETNALLKRVWGIDSPKVGESVCDAIAIMLYTYFTSLRSDSKVNAEVLQKNRDDVMSHIWKQAARVYVLAGFSQWNGLNVRGTPISKLGDDGCNRGIEFKYQQDTSVFEYYIIKAFLMQSYPAGEVRILTTRDIIDICADPTNVAIFNCEITKRLKELKKASEAKSTVTNGGISLRMTPKLGLTGGRVIVSLQGEFKGAYKKAYSGYHNCVVKR